MSSPFVTALIRRSPERDLKLGARASLPASVREHADCLSLQLKLELKRLLLFALTRSMRAVMPALPASRPARVNDAVRPFHCPDGAGVGVGVGARRAKMIGSAFMTPCPSCTTMSWLALTCCTEAFSPDGQTISSVLMRSVPSGLPKPKVSVSSLCEA